MKETFTINYKIQYKGEIYIVLQSKRYPFYLVKYNKHTNKAEYPTLEVFQELFKKYMNEEEILLFEGKTLLTEKKRKTISLKPLVKTANGFISLFLAISLSGCTQVVPKEEKEEPEQIAEGLSAREQVEAYFGSYAMDILFKEYDAEEFIFLKSYIDSSNRKQVYLENIEELRALKGLSQSPSYEEVKTAFEENQNLESSIKGFILDNLEKMSSVEELKTLDLTTLYTNAKRMTCQEITQEEMRQRTGKEDAPAAFEPITATVYTVGKLTEDTFPIVHEILGHGSLAYKEQIGDTVYNYACINRIMLGDESGYTAYALGNMVSEGGANLIAHFVTNDKESISFYELAEEQLSLIAHLCHVSIGELLNKRGLGLYDLMYENGVNIPMNYISQIDGLLKGQLFGDYQELMIGLAYDATEEKVREANEQEKQLIIDETKAAIQSHLPQKRDTLKFEYETEEGIDYITYDKEESANLYEDRITFVKGK